MSKFLNIFGPAASGAAVVLGAAYFLADQLVVDIPAPVRGQIVPEAMAEDSAPAPAVVEMAATPAGLEPAPKLNLGRPATEDEIAAWDLNVMPDGRGLPVGSGSVEDGEMLFSENCAVCHGEFAEGAGNWPKLAGGDGSLADEDPLKTVGSYWPYLSTAFDYVHRSMPFGDAQTLNADETYAIVAYILYSNFLVEDDFVLSNENFLDVEMPNADGFIVDDRPETEYPLWRTEPCMEGCKDSVEITMRATVLDVTPDEGGDDAAPMEDHAEAAPVEAAPTEAAPVEVAEVAEEPAAEAPGPDPALVASGEKVFRKCKACHQVGDGAKNRTGPLLNNVVGREIASVEGFRYSNPFKDKKAEGFIWDHDTLSAYLADPKGYLPGNKMAFKGLNSDDDIAAVIAYLRSFGG